MSIEAWTQTPVYTVSGIGPYAITHPYELDAIVAYVIVLGSLVSLGISDFSLEPTASTARGSFYLTPEVAAIHSGRNLIIDRQTVDEQGWLGVQGEREKGLEQQLDRMVQSIQELRNALKGTVRIREPLDVFDWLEGTVPIRLGNTVVSGPSGADIVAAELFAQNAAGFSQSAGESATLALNAERSNIKDGGVWAAGQSYNKGFLVTQTGQTYLVLVDHVSAADISSDLASGRIRIFAARGAAGLGSGDVLIVNALAEFSASLLAVHTNLMLRPGVDIQPYSARLALITALPLVQGDMTIFDGTNIVPFAKGPPRTILRMDNDGSEQEWGDISPLIGQWTYSANVTAITFLNLAGWQSIEIDGAITASTAFRIELSPDNGVTWRAAGYVSQIFDGVASVDVAVGIAMARAGGTANFQAEISRFATPLKTSGKTQGHIGGRAYSGFGFYNTSEIHNAIRFVGATFSGGSVQIFGKRQVSGISLAANTGLPVISTTGKIGAAQSASVGTFTDAASIESRWTVAGLVVGTGVNYTPVAADDAKNLVRQSRGLDINGIPSVWASSAPVVVTYVAPVVSLPPTILPVSAVAGSIFNLTNGAGTPNGAPTIEYFRLDGVSKAGELSSLSWDSTGEAAGAITFKMRYTNSGGFVLSDEITATLTAAAAVPSAYTVGMWGLANVPSTIGDKLSINIISNPANNGSAQTAIYWKNGAGALQLLSGGAALGAREITVPATTLANIKIYAANAIGTATLDSDTKSETPTIGADTIPPAISGLSISGNVFAFTLSEPATNYLLINNSATPLGGSSEAAADAIKAAVIATTPIVEDTFSAVLGVNNRTLNLTPLSNGTWYIHEAAFDAALNRSAASPYGFTYVAPGGGGNVAFASATPMLLTSVAGTVFNSTLDHTVGSGADKCVLVTIKGLSAVAGVPTISPITFGGAAMTEVIAPVGSTGKDWIAVYRIMAPSSGAKALAFTCSTTQNAIEAYAEEYTEVNQATPIAHAVSVTTGGSFVTTLATPRTTVANGNMVIGALVLENGGYAADIDVDSAATLVTSQTGTSANSDISVGNSRLAMPAIGAGGHAWTWVTVDRGTAILVELAAA